MELAGETLKRDDARFQARTLHPRHHGKGFVHDLIAELRDRPASSAMEINSSGGIQRGHLPAHKGRQTGVAPIGHVALRLQDTRISSFTNASAAVSVQRGPAAYRWRRITYYRRYKPPPLCLLWYSARSALFISSSGLLPSRGKWRPHAWPDGMMSSADKNDSHRHGEGCHQLVHEERDIRLGVRVGQQDGKFVAAQPRNRVGMPEGGLYMLGNLT